MHSTALVRSLLSLSILLPLCLSAQEIDARTQTSEAATAPRIQVPRVIRISGALDPASTSPSLQTITFTLYKDQAGEVPIWSETQNVEVSARGGYSALLGADTPDGIPFEIFSTADARWLGVQVSGQQEQPLVMFVSVPYALKAADAETLGGRPPSSYVTVDQLGRPPERSSDDLRNLQAAAETPITGFGVPKHLSKFVTTTRIGSSLFYDTGFGISLSNDGIDRNPRSLLDINGQVLINNRLTLTQDLGETTPTWHFDNSQGLFRLFFQPNLNTSGYVALAADTLGKIGIYNETPRSTFDVNGEIVASARLTLAQDSGISTPTWHLENTNSLFRLYTQPTINTYGTNILSATTSGRVGISTESPRTTLDVAGSIIATPRLTLTQNTDTTTPTWTIENSNSLFRLFQQPTLGGSGSTVLVATQGGRIGIGVTDPTYKLDVDGSIGLKGSGNGIIFPDGSVQTSAARRTLYGICISHSTWPPPNCSCNHLLSQMTVVDGATCTVTGVSNACSATSSTSQSIYGRTWGVCCVCD